MLRVICAVTSYAVGLFLMIGADAQKYFTLKVRSGLIKDGFFAYTRNPNYLGEILIYLSFGLVAKSSYVYGSLGFAWVAAFIPRMLSKDASLSSKPDFAAYERNTYLLLPKVFKGDQLNAALYGTLAVIALAAYLLAG